RRKQVTMSSISRDLNPHVTMQAVDGVIKRIMVSNRIMEAVANAIDRDKAYVFPEYFLKKAN
ncbi:MAG: hypothetical protein PF495_02220, partial [Spirochaetales bacterium]|nr:hypothetical protein [Spirochaetales bacterium]